MLTDTGSPALDAQNAILVHPYKFPCRPRGVMLIWPAMSVTIDFPDEERAFHEAGHVVVAYLLREHFPVMNWATILGAGGSCDFGQGYPVPREQYIAMYWGGICAQIRFRGRVLGESDDVARFRVSASTDMRIIESALQRIQLEEDKAACRDAAFGRAEDLVNRHWEKVEHIARELKDAEHKTLFHDEAYRSLDALVLGDPEDWNILHAYRKLRRPAPAPEGWDGRSEWLESFMDWYARDPTQPGETPSQWRARRLASGV